MQHHSSAARFAILATAILLPRCGEGGNDDDDGGGGGDKDKKIDGAKTMPSA